VFSNAAKGVGIVVGWILGEILMLFIEQFGNGGKLYRYRANPSDRVVLDFEKWLCHGSLYKVELL
jgi:hypothetical protein